MEDLDDDEGRRLEEQLRTKVHKANFWAYPPEHQRDPAEGARPQDPGRNFHGPHQQVPRGIQPPVPGAAIFLPTVPLEPPAPVPANRSGLIGYRSV